MGKKDYTYFIIHQDNLTGEQFLNSKLSILGNARKSSNNNVLIYTDDPSNSCFSGLTGYTSVSYTHLTLPTKCRV